MKKRVSAILLALCLALTLLPTAAFAGGGAKSIDFDTFLKALESMDGDITFDGSEHENAEAGKLTVKWSPTSGCSDGRESHRCTVENVAATGNTPTKVNSGNAQYIILSTADNVTIKNVNFVYEAADFTLCMNSGNAGTFKEAAVLNAQVYLENTGNTTIENCSFDRIVFTSWKNTGSTTIKGCSFSNIYNSYAIKDLGGSSAEVSNCTFTDCGGAIMTNSNGERTGDTSLTIRNNTFTNIDVDGTAAAGKVGTRGVLQFASNSALSAITIDGNKATNCGPIVRQLNSGAMNLIYQENNWMEIQKLAGTNGNVFTTNTTVVAVASVTHSGNTTYYTTIQGALTAASDDDTIKLLRDVELSTTIFLEKSLTLELNGHTISAADSWARVNADTKYGGQTDAMFVVVGGATLTINDNSANKDGTITAATANKDTCYAAIKLTATSESVNTGTESLVVNSGNIVGNYYGVCGNGGRSDSQIIINDGTIKGTVVDDSTSIYHAQGGKLIINGGVLEGATGLYVKSGTVTISGGAIIGNGKKEEFNHSDNGFGNTGDALVVEACGYTYGNPVVSVIGGTFISENAEAVAYYKYNENKLENEKFISGGSFSTDPSAYAADGFTGYQNPDGTYGVVKATEEEITRSATVNIVVKPADASIVLAKDGDVIGTAAGEYNLPGGLYTLTVTKRGYYPERKFIFVEGEKQTVYVALERISTGSGTASAATYSIKTAAAANGDVTASAKSAAKGAIVTITVAADKGYTLETLTVTDQKGNEIALTDKGNGVYTFTMPASNVTVAATFMEDNTILNFYVDVPASAYYYNEVLWAVKNGITSDINGEFFGPNKDCTRAELAAFIYRYVQSCGGGFTGLWMFQLPFSDVPEWCYEQAAWCYMNEIVKGYDNGLFGSDDPITREQVATILYRLVRAMGKDTTQGGMAIREFKDYESISDFAMEAMEWAVNTGVLQGYDGNLMPKEHCSHAQIVLMLYRLLSE